MTETKQRIWPHYPLGDGKTEYLRADVAEAEKQLAVAAALKEAADVAWRFYAKGQVTKPSDIKALLPDAGAALDRALAAERERLLNAADTLGYECEGCGHICGNPDKDLAILRKAGARACCPERKMRPLSAAFRAQGET